LRRRAACILPRNQDGADLLIPFFIRDEEDIKFGAILVQVKNYWEASDAKDVGRKFLGASLFEHWGEKDPIIPFFRVVLELGLCRANTKKLQSLPLENMVDLLEVCVTLDQTTPREEGEATFIVTCSDSQEEERFIVCQEELHTVKEEKVKFLRLRGIEGVPWMDEGTYNGFIELLGGPLAPGILSSWTAGVNTTCFWNERPFFAGLKEKPVDE
jgi:hypothetical protein